jgi:replicative DNA helicase
MSKTSVVTKLDLDYFEGILLLNALSDQEYLSSIVSYLDPALFVDKGIARVITGINRFFVERGTVPTLTEVKARMSSEEDKKALNDVKVKLSQLETKFNKDELLVNTERFLKERFIYKTILNVADKFSEESFRIEDALQEFEQAYNITLSENLGHWYFEDIEKFTKELLQTYKPIPTGWKFFDDKCEGGLFPKTLTVFAGQVNVGKSIVLGNVTTNLLLADKNVLLVTLEMSEFMYAKRISTQLTQIPHNELKTFTSEIKESLDKLKKNLNSRLVIKEYPPKTVTVRQIDAFVTKLKHKGFVPDIIVVDYVNLIHPIAKNLNSYESVKEICEHLRALSFKHSLPIVSATQLNRGSFNTASPGMEGISESIGLAATCDVICSLWQEPEDRELGIINMGMQKNRFGPNYGSAAFRCNYHTLTLKETNPDYFEEDSPSTENVVRNIDDALNTISNES